MGASLVEEYKSNCKLDTPVNLANSYLLGNSKLLWLKFSLKLYLVKNLDGFCFGSHGNWGSDLVVFYAQLICRLCKSSGDV